MGFSWEKINISVDSEFRVVIYFKLSNQVLTVTISNWRGWIHTICIR